MKKAAIEKARARLKRAHEAYTKLQKSANFGEFEPAWIDFVTALNTIYSVLEQGSKSSPQSRQWFGRKKRERREDPLLQYIHQARNADEHGIEPIAQHVPGSLSIDADDRGPVLVNKLVMMSGTITHYDVTTPQGKPIPPTITPARPQLVTVRDNRYGDTFSPPKTHLGKALRSGSPYEVAELALIYHSSLIEEAASIT